MTTKAVIISDTGRSPIVAEKRTTGGVVIRAARATVALSDTEVARLAAFAKD